MFGTINTSRDAHIVFCARRRQKVWNDFVITGRFRQHAGVFNASAQGTSENLGYITEENNI